MGTWTGRGASARIRSLAFVAIGTVVVTIFILFGSYGAPDQTPARIDVDTPAETSSEAPAAVPNPSRPPGEEENDPERLPPLYPELKVAELALPQHDEDLPFPEGKNARFVRFGNQMWGVGLNNQLFEM